PPGAAPAPGLGRLGLLLGSVPPARAAPGVPLDVRDLRGEPVVLGTERLEAHLDAGGALADDVEGDGGRLAPLHPDRVRVDLDEVDLEVGTPVGGGRTGDQEHR